MSSNHGQTYSFNHIKGVMTHLKEIAHQFSIDIDAQLEEETIEHVITHYYDHVKTYNVRVTGIDPYKFTAWAGMYLFRRTDNNKMLSATIAALRRYLKSQGKTLEDRFCQKLLLTAWAP